MLASFAELSAHTDSLESESPGTTFAANKIIRGVYTKL